MPRVFRTALPSVAPPAGNEPIQRSNSSVGYLTSDPTFTNRGPRLSRRQRRKHARLTRSNSATSGSVRSAPVIQSLLSFPNQRPRSDPPVQQPSITPDEPAPK